LPSCLVRRAGVPGLVALAGLIVATAAGAQTDRTGGVGPLPIGIMATGPGNSADGPLHGLVASIPVGASPSDVAVSPDGKRLYVANLAADTISVVDAVTHTLVSTVTVDDQPVAVALSPDGTRLYVAHGRTGLLTSIDTSTDTATATLDVGLYAMDVAVSVDGATVYVALGAAGLAVVDAASRRLLATVPTGGFASQVAVSPDGARVYVAVRAPEPTGPEVRPAADSVGVIDALANTLVASIAISGAPAGISGLAVSPDGGRVYAGSARSEHLSIIDAAALVEISRSRIAALPAALAVSPDGTQLYVTNRMMGPVLVISTSDRRTAFINGVTRSSGVVVSPDGALAYVAVPGSGVVMAFDTASVAD